MSKGIHKWNIKHHYSIDRIDEGVMSQEEELKKILTQAYVSNDKEFQKQAVDTAATYGLSAITYLRDFNTRLNDEELKRYVMTKIQELKANNP